jgi:hypothetical protein
MTRSCWLFCANAPARRRAKEQYEIELKSLKKAVAAKEGALDKSRSDELILRRQLRELEEAKKNQDLDYQRKLDEERKRIEAHARSAAGEEFGRREAQLKAQIDSAQREAADLKRKLEQGAVQFQGEGLEVSLETLLRNAFPLDEFVPVPKGMAGGCAGAVRYRLNRFSVERLMDFLIRLGKDVEIHIAPRPSGRRRSTVHVRVQTPRGEREPLVELMSPARGMVDSGVPDLGSNPKHLKRFGRGPRRHR